MSGYNFLSASDGTGPSVLAHVTFNRLIGATVLKVDSVDNYPAEFIYVTGTLLPSGFINPATITEMRCHLNAGDIIIDGYEPGYADAGNTAGQVGIIKQTTGWADSMVANAKVAHNNDGTLKNTSLDSFFKPSDLFGTFVASGGVIAISAGLIGTFSDIYFYYNGLRYFKTAIPNKTYTASKDTYVDVSTAGVVTYVEVANGATSGMALTANSVRVAKVVTSGAAITSIQQYAYDPLNNSIYPQNLSNQRVTHVRVEVGSGYTALHNQIVRCTNKIFDSLGEFNTGTYTWTCTKAGLYEFKGRFWWGSAGAGTNEQCTAWIYINGGGALSSDQMEGSGNASRYIRPLVTGSIWLKPGDTATLVFAGSNNVRDIVAGLYSFLEIHRIG